MPKGMEQFLDRYREIESMLGELGCENGFRGAEEWCEANGLGKEKEYLRMCRSVRNFAVHVSGGAEFLSSEKAMVKYLDSVKRELVSRMDTVSKHLDRGQKAMCEITDTVCSVVGRMGAARRTHILVVGPGKIAVDVVDIFGLVGVEKPKSMKMGLFLKSRRPAKLTFVKPDTMMSDVPAADVVICTKTGDGTSPVVGIVKSV